METAHGPSGSIVYQNVTLFDFGTFQGIFVDCLLLLFFLADYFPTVSYIVFTRVSETYSLRQQGTKEPDDERSRKQPSARSNGDRGTQ